MQLRNLLLLIVAILITIVTVCVHYDAKQSCLMSQKPKTASTGYRFVSPFTGKYERLNGVLFCYDSKGVLHEYRARVR